MKKFILISALAVGAVVFGVVGKKGLFTKFMEAKSTSIVIVGMENSKKFGKCDGAKVDALSMKELLSKYATPVVMIDREATQANVVNALKEAVKSELCIFYYSGHGGSERFSGTNASQGMEPTGKDQYLCLYDSHLLDDAIWNIISGAKGRVMMVFDCCHSETMFRGVSDDTVEIRSSPFTMQKLDDVVLPQGSDLKILVWSGCPDDNYSYGDSTGGVFTKAIRASYSESKTYDKVWEGARAKTTSERQIPKKTEIGNWPNVRVFR